MMRWLRSLGWFGGIYLAVGTGLVGLYLAATLSGWEVNTAPRGVVPADVRHAPGGYRSFHFWHIGYRGGK